MVYEAAVQRVLNSGAPAQGTQAWLAWRQSRLTASDVPIVVGNGVKGRRSLIDRKSGAESVRFSGNEFTAAGHVNEPVAIARYVSMTGRTVHANLKPVEHPIYPGLAASLDGMTACGRNIEVKTLHADKASARPKPAHVYQAQMQMACAGLPVTDLLYYYINLDGRMDVHTIEYDHSWFTANLPRFEAFLRDLHDACLCKFDVDDLLFEENDLLTHWPTTPSPTGSGFSFDDEEWPPLSPRAAPSSAASTPSSFSAWTAEMRSDPPSDADAATSQSSVETDPLDITLVYPLDLSLPDAPAYRTLEIVPGDDPDQYMPSA